MHKKKDRAAETFSLRGSSYQCTNETHAGRSDVRHSRKPKMSSRKSATHTLRQGQKAQAKWCALSVSMEASLTAAKRQDTLQYSPLTTSISFANPEVGT